MSIIMINCFLLYRNYNSSALIASVLIVLTYSFLFIVNVNIYAQHFVTRPM